MSVNQITVIGNLTRKPVLRYAPNGDAVTDLTVAENFRRRDRTSGEWRDVAKTYYTVTCWRQLAEHAAQSLEKGHPVVVIGRLYIDEWADRDGVLRKTPKIDPTSVGYDLRYSSVLAPLRSPSGPDREGGAVSRAAEAWDEPPAGEVEEPEDPFDPDAAEQAGVRQAVGAVPGSEA